MAVPGAVDRVPIASPGFGIGPGVGAGGQKGAALREIDSRQSAYADARPQRRIVRPPEEREPETKSRAAPRPAAPFLAQLIAQSGPSPSNDDEARRLAARRQFGGAIAADPIVEAQRRRSTLDRVRNSAEETAQAYDRVKLSAREFAARRYGVARDPDGIFFSRRASSTSPHERSQ